MNPLSVARLWLLDHLPDGLLANPGEWFLSVLCILSGISIVTGVGSAKSTEVLLGWFVYVVWGASLLLGGLAMACGLSSVKFTQNGRHIVTRVACYRLGLRLLGLAALMYGVAILIAGGWNGVVAAGITFAFSGMCGVRLLTIGSVT